jgi:protein-arginine kinase
MREILNTEIPEERVIAEHAKLFRDEMRQIKFPIILSDEEIRDIVEQNGDTLKKICEMPENAHKIAYVISPDKEYVARAIDIAYKLR